MRSLFNFTLFRNMSSNPPLEEQGSGKDMLVDRKVLECFFAGLTELRQHANEGRSIRNQLVVLRRRIKSELNALKIR